MKTIVLRFSENFSPECGTIKAHEAMIEKNGYVWYGKMGAKVSKKVIDEVFLEDSPRILLIQSGKTGRYWAYIDKAQDVQPPKSEIPEYYREQAGMFHYWFRVIKFEEAESDVMVKCTVTSSGKTLSNASRQSMSPYFRVDYEL